MAVRLAVQAGVGLCLLVVTIVRDNRIKRRLADARTVQPSFLVVVVASQSLPPFTARITLMTPLVLEVRPLREIFFSEYSISQSTHLLCLMFGETTTIVTEVSYIMSARDVLMFSVDVSMRSGESDVSPW